MPVARRQTPYARPPATRPAARAPARGAPASASSAAAPRPPHSTPVAPLPNLPFAPLHMVASSSGCPPNVQLTPQPVVETAVPVVAPAVVTPACHAVPAVRSASTPIAETSPTPRSGSFASYEQSRVLERSKSRSPSPPAPQEPGAAAPALSAEASEEEEVESSAGDSSRPPSPASTVRVRTLGVWMPPGRPELAAVLAFVFVYPPERAANDAAALIRDTLAAEAVGLHYTMLPSSRGAMQLRFPSPEERDAAVGYGPYLFEGGHLKLERAEDSPNRFTVELPWVAAVAAKDFPPEHWFPENVPHAFACLGPVLEIDDRCFGDDRSSMRVVVAVEQPEVPAAIWVAGPGVRAGNTVQLTAIKVWPRAMRFTDAEQYIPFFNLPPPPPPPPSNHPQSPRANARFGPPRPAAPAPMAPASGFVGPFPGYATYVYGFLNPYPLAKLPSFPIVIQLSFPPPSMPTLPVARLALPWRDDDAAPALPPGAGLAGASRPRGAPPAATRHSSRLAAKEGELYAAVGDKASHLRALRDDLSSCSAAMQQQVGKRQVMEATKFPLPAADLRKLATTAMGSAAQAALNKVLRSVNV
ncbi:hypothetical protein BS78_06G122200 [Paspalum vaginatum]|nr:hypothetical protein BS78_06G122200 [Paspalum vaginatum]